MREHVQTRASVNVSHARIGGVDDGVSDSDVSKPCDHDDVPCVSFIHSLPQAESNNGGVEGIVLFVQCGQTITRTTLMVVRRERFSAFLRRRFELFS